jgi:transposase
VTRADLDAVGQVLDTAAARGETWTTPRLQQWLATERGVRISTGRLGVLLRRERLRWKRTKHSVRHLQKDPALQAAATAHLESLRL